MISNWRRSTRTSTMWRSASVLNLPTISSSARRPSPQATRLRRRSFPVSVWNGFTIAGQWSRLDLSHNTGALTDTATGGVFASGDRPRAWVPALAFGGGTTGLTYNFHDGLISRTSTGGFTASGRVALTAKGTSTGLATVSGLPYTCVAGASSSTPQILSAFTGLTGNAMAQLSGNVVNFIQGAPAGAASISTPTSPTRRTSSLPSIVRQPNEKSPLLPRALCPRLRRHARRSRGDDDDSSYRSRGGVEIPLMRTPPALATLITE